MGRSKVAIDDLVVCSSCGNRARLTKVSFTFSVGTFELEICDPCADEFTDEMIRWSRLGTLIDEHPQALRRPRRDPQPASRGTVAWSMFELPDVASTVSPDDEDDDEETFPIVVRPRVSPDLPPGHEDWAWSDHAIERLEERARLGEELGLDPITDRDVRWCVADPEITRPSSDPKQPGCLIHVRGHAHVVVNPSQHIIVTVIDRRLPSQEEELQIA